MNRVNYKDASIKQFKNGFFYAFKEEITNHVDLLKMTVMERLIGIF